MKKLLIVFLTLFLILNIGSINVFASENQNDDINSTVVNSNGITPRMQIFIKVKFYDKDKHITLEVEPTDKVKEVKEKIYDKEGIEPNRMVLIFEGQVLEDENILQDYTIIRDSIIYSYLKNYWVEEPNIKDSIYLNNLEYSAKAFYSDVYFLFSDKKDGEYTKQEPKNVGTYYMKAVVDAKGSYVKLESEPIEFKISPLNVENDKNLYISEITKDTNINDIGIKYKDVTLKKDTDYTIKKDINDNTVDFYITFKGNFEGTIKKSVYINDSVNIGNENLNNNNDKTDIKKQPTSSVKTSDEENIVLWSIMLMVCCSFIVLFTKMLKNQK